MRSARCMHLDQRTTKKEQIDDKALQTVAHNYNLIIIQIIFIEQCLQCYHV